MKLNINPKELLALYNALYDRFDGPNAHDICEYKEDDPRAGDAVQLKQVYNRLRAIIVAGLTNPGKVVDPVESWLKHEQEKVDKLNDQNETLKVEARDLVKPVSPADILTDDEGEVPDDLAYPSRRRGPPPPNMPHSGKHRGRRK